MARFIDMNDKQRAALWAKEARAPAETPKEEFVAAVLWTNDEGHEREEVKGFYSEFLARRWLDRQHIHETQTKELWQGRRPIAL